MSVCQDQRNVERQCLKEQQKTKINSEEDQFKEDYLRWVMDYFEFELKADLLKRGQCTIKANELEAISESKKAFVKVTSRKANQ